MSEHRPAIKRGIRRRLLEEAGGKCANPGCTITRAHIHHIMEWHIYGVHDSDHMIAVCPSCHDEIHHGRLGIPDATLYAWKNLQRSPQNDYTTQLAVEPSKKIKIVCGSVDLETTSNSLVVFKLSNLNHLGFTIEDGDGLLLNLRLTDLRNVLVLKVTDNRVRALKDDSVCFEQRQGRIRVTAPASERYIAPRCLATMRRIEPGFAIDDRLTILDAEVIAPGTIKVLGVWQATEGAIVITEAGITSINAAGFPIAVQKMTISVECGGPITAKVFGF